MPGPLIHFGSTIHPSANLEYTAAVVDIKGHVSSISQKILVYLLFTINQDKKKGVLKN